MPELKEYKGQEGVYLWKYVPSLPAGAAFAVFFLLCTVIISIRMIRSRAWFNIPWVIGGLMEVVAFATRALATNETDSLLLYSIQVILILVAPALFAASIYMALSRLMRKLEAEKYSVVSARWSTIIFVGGDVVSFLIIAAGASMSTSPDADPELTKWIVLVGLFVQLAFFALFLVTAVIFQRRLSLNPTSLSLSGSMPWRFIMLIEYILGAFFMVRSIFRVVEYAMGLDTYLFVNEWPAYALDAAPMLASMAVWAIFFPKQLSQRFSLKSPT